MSLDFPSMSPDFRRLYPKLSAEGLLLFCGVPAEGLDDALDAYKAQREIAEALRDKFHPSTGEELDYTLNRALKCCPVSRAHDFDLFGFGRFNLELVETCAGGPVPLDDPLAEQLILSSRWMEDRGGLFGPSPIAALKALGCEGLYWS